MEAESAAREVSRLFIPFEIPECTLRLGLDVMKPFAVPETDYANPASCRAIQITIENGWCYAVATNGKMLALLRLVAIDGPDRSVTIPIAAAELLCNTLSRKSQAPITVCEKQIARAGLSFDIPAPLELFPTWRRCMPKNDAPASQSLHAIGVDVGYLTQICAAYKKLGGGKTRQGFRMTFGDDPESAILIEGDGAETGELTCILMPRRL